MRKRSTSVKGTIPNQRTSSVCRNKARKDRFQKSVHPKTKREDETSKRTNNGMESLFTHAERPDKLV